MTAAEYGSMENQVMAALQQLREKGVSGDDIGILMSREVYDMAKAGGNSAYAVSVENFRAIYWGYDIYVIAEDSPPIFSPVITRFSDNFGVLQFDAGTFLISESDDGTLRVYTKPTQEHAFFCETEFTVCQAHQMERVTFADRIRAGQERERGQRMYMPLHEWSDWMPYTALQPDFLASQPTWSELEWQLDEIVATMQRGTGSATPKKKKAPPKKDWDERLTPEDTKELDEFLNSLTRKGTLESAT